jgi:hypothetical protein
MKSDSVVWIGDQINFLLKKKEGDIVVVKNPNDGKLYKAIFYKLRRGQTKFEGCLISNIKRRVLFYTQFIVIK